MRSTTDMTRSLVLTAVLIALTLLMTIYTKIPVPGIRGYFNIGDAVIMTTALLLGRRQGAYVGAIGSALADLFLGYAVFAPLTFIVKGIEGYTVGGSVENRAGLVKAFFRTVMGGIIIVGGYFAGEWIIFDIGVAVASIPANTVQAAASIIISTALYMALRKRI